LTLLTLAALMPFLTKPFNMDDPLFLWAAQQIQSHPTDPYGFRVNWYGFSQPMWQVTQNPPLFSYYLAVMASFLGFGEIAMHAACSLPAVAVVLGTYRLAKSLCRWPWLVAVVTLFEPGFLVSATTVMCDVPMLSFWIWSVVFWVEGLRENQPWKLTASGILLALALFTKYYGACLIPLLAAYSCFACRPVCRWVWYLLIPVALFLLYQYMTFRLYGQGLFSAAAAYALNGHESNGIFSRLAGFNALTFTGGSLAGALFCAPYLWGRRTLILIVMGAGLLAVVALCAGGVTKHYPWLHDGVRTGVEGQVFVWLTGGMFVLALAIAEVWQKRDAASWLLALWVVGVLAFSAFFNWTVNTRSILPMAPAVALLMFRRLEQNRSELPATIGFPIIAAAILSLLVAQTDFQEASISRQATQLICARYAGAPGRLWFEGHWGLQYYLQSAGAWPLDSDRLDLVPGDLLIVPEENSNAELVTSKIADLHEALKLTGPHGLATLNINLGAGFYSSQWGPLPFAFGSVPPEKYFVYVLKNPDEGAH
jgi:4-amino-4-deoxy-L-arabinose transferase-like glycosyltransferase